MEFIKELIEIILAVEDYYKLQSRAIKIVEIWTAGNSFPEDPYAVLWNSWLDTLFFEEVNYMNKPPQTVIATMKNIAFNYEIGLYDEIIKEISEKRLILNL